MSKNIPKEIIYFSNKNSNSHGYAGPPNNSTRIKQIEKWLGNNSIIQKPKENKPINDVTIIRVQDYTKGEFWFVKTDGFTFKVNYDFIEDAVVNTKIDNGLVDAEYIWVNIRGCSLVRIGSKEYKELESKDNIISNGSIRQIPGGVYEDLNGNKYLFLGKMSTIEIDSYNKNSSNYYSYNKQPQKFVRTQKVITGFAYIQYKEPISLQSLDIQKTKKKLYKEIKTIDISGDWLENQKNKVDINDWKASIIYNLGLTDLHPKMKEKFKDIPLE